MMGLMARVELGAIYRSGVGGNRTEKMIGYLRTYVCADREVCDLLVRMWRHALMHTAKPRRLPRRDGRYYHWLLHWSDDLPRNQHLMFEDTEDTRKLNVGFFDLLVSLRDGTTRFLKDVRSNTLMTRVALTAYEQVQLGRF